MKILIAGSRTFENYDYLVRKMFKHIDSKYNYPEGIEIVSGHASGTDLLGERFANEYHYKLQVFPADWNTYGKAAGILRNYKMALYLKETPEPESRFAVLFWDGISKGTDNMIKTLANLEITTFVYRVVPGADYGNIYDYGM